MTKITVLAFILFLNCSSLYGWTYNVPLTKILQGECNLVAPRVCKQITNETDPDYTCGFIFRDVCTGYYHHSRTKRRQKRSDSGSYVSTLYIRLVYFLQVCCYFIISWRARFCVATLPLLKFLLI